MSRLFLAFELPEHIKQRLLDIREPLRGARWQRADQLHLTLRFLGDVDDTATLQILESLSGLRSAAPEIRLHGTGCFGGSHRPFAFWAGVAPELPLVQVREEIDSRLVPLALAPDRHAGFKPHVTLARIRGGDASAVRCAERHAGLTSEPFTLDAVSLFSSQQGLQGSIYSVLHRFPLSGSGNIAPEPGC
ncbi:RNA 2',3'-cyclic phosphodiesterase [Pseudomonas saliphila]|uniref:RNA 2',3'-cyclic phosphodiesterase n=1 Tax=Pseudomonas saliphila TaxID=2586906 RepID=UPI00123BE00E|nr:RNA 2',3'-cyclic phosphodiesterase [Pseudomonas saliphila]